MMRELKFRAWNGKKMVFGPTDDNPSSSWILSMCSAYGIEPEQFTGLKDKNGKEIYEGDILQHHSGMVPKGSNPIVKNTVRWKTYQWIGINNWGMCEVIGNIHENHEVLEKS